MIKNIYKKIKKNYANTFRIKILGFKALPSKMNFLQKLHPTFSKLDIFKMSIFQNLTPTFSDFFNIFITTVKKLC